MTLQDTIAACKTELLAQAPRIVQTQAQTQLALVTLRVQDIGLVGKLYASGDYPLFWFKDRELNARGKAWYEGKKKRTKQERKSDPANWAGFRAAQGLPIQAVNLTYTGRMFRSLTTIAGGVSGTVYSAQIVASDEEEANKVRWNMARYGDFLAPLPSEAVEIAQYGQNELARIVNQFFQQ